MSVPNVSKYFKQGRGDLLSYTEASPRKRWESHDEASDVINGLASSNNCVLGRRIQKVKPTHLEIPTTFFTHFLVW